MWFVHWTSGEYGLLLVDPATTDSKYGELGLQGERREGEKDVRSKAGKNRQKKESSVVRKNRLKKVVREHTLRSSLGE